MKKLHLIACLSLAWTMTTAAFAAESLDQIVDRHVETRGGASAFTSVESYRATGVMALNAEMHGGQELQGEFSLEWRTPNRIRLQFELMGNDFIQATDGRTGWTLAPRAGVHTPQELPQAELEGLRDYADLILGPLTMPKSGGVEVRLAGQADVEGTETYRIEVAWPDGRATTYFVETETALPIQLVAERSFQGSRVSMTRTLSDYKAVSGLLLPHFLELRNEVGIVLQTFSVDTIELGAEISEDRFVLPAGQAGE